MLMVVCDSTYFDSSGVDSKRNTKFHSKKNIKRNSYRIQSYNSIMCEYVCIAFIDFTRGNSLLGYTNVFSPGEYETNDNIILKYFQ